MEKKKKARLFGVVVVLTKKTLNLKTLNYFCVSEKLTSLAKKKKTTHSKKEKNEEEETREGRSAARDLRFRSLLSFLKRAAYTNNNNNNTSAFSIVVVVVVVHAHRERKSFPKLFFFGEKKKPRPRGI